MHHRLANRIGAPFAIAVEVPFAKQLLRSNQIGFVLQIGC
jgi:hypothetical protein